MHLSLYAPYPTLSSVAEPGLTITTFMLETEAERVQVAGPQLLVRKRADNFALAELGARFPSIEITLPRGGIASVQANIILPTAEGRVNCTLTVTMEGPKMHGMFAEGRQELGCHCFLRVQSPTLTHFRAYVIVPQAPVPTRPAGEGDIWAMLRGRRAGVESKEP